jgi:hypothetical protein
MSDDALDLVFRKARNYNACLFPKRIQRRLEQDSNEYELRWQKEDDLNSVYPIDVLKSPQFDGYGFCIWL